MDCGQVWAEPSKRLEGAGIRSTRQVSSQPLRSLLVERFWRRAAYRQLTRRDLRAARAGSTALGIARAESYHGASLRGRKESRKSRCRACSLARTGTSGKRPPTARRRLATRAARSAER